jgi:hypothetical protein
MTWTYDLEDVKDRLCFLAISTEELFACPRIRQDDRQMRTDTDGFQIEQLTQ